MIGKQSKRQTGLALLLFLLIMMGLGGIALTGVTQKALKQVEDRRFKHNERVLKEAKQALLMFAYNYPVTQNNGPGRLPCPDNDNDGNIGSSPDCDLVGRLPWLDVRLNIPELKDASGETLWYAVSREFQNYAPSEVGANTNGYTVVNSDSLGTISIFDQTGSIIYDGAVSGVAAVIIAPGSAISRDNDNNGIYETPQLRGTEVQKNDPENYLDTFSGFDNSNFLDGFSALANGFILGPIRETRQASPAVNTVVVNDQMVVITTKEVIEMAEKATLDAYRTTIKDYLTNTGGVYPWLYNYEGVTDVDSNYYPAYLEADGGFATELSTNLGDVGRIPSFQGYFTEADSQPIVSKLSGSIVMSYFPQSIEVGHSGGSGVFKFYYSNNSDPVAAHTLTFQTVNKLDDLQFVELAPNDHGRLKGTVTVNQSFSHEIYFWDRQVQPFGDWQMCDGDAASFTDCNRDEANFPAPSGPNKIDQMILKITLTMAFNAEDVVEFDTNYDAPPVVLHPIAASNLGHAQVSATFDGAAVIAMPTLTASFEIDDEYNSDDTTFNVTNFGPLDDLDDLTLDSLTLGLRYYPELPSWAFTDGWHNSIMMAYAFAYQPDGTGTDCTEGIDCIEINGFPGNQDNKKSLLIIAGEHDWIDGDAASQPVVAADTFFTDEVNDIFNLENSDLDSTFDIRSVGDASAFGDTKLDKILVIDEL